MMLARRENSRKRPGSLKAAKIDHMSIQVSDLPVHCLLSKVVRLTTVVKTNNNGVWECKSAWSSHHKSIGLEDHCDRR
jgi:hypothetical protein